MNAWNQEKCRTCGTLRNNDLGVEERPLSAEVDTPEELPQPEKESKRDSSIIPPFPRRRWNAFWIFLGIAVHVFSIHLGVFAIVKLFIEPDPAMKTTIEKTIEAAKNGGVEKTAILESLPPDTQSRLSMIRTILISLLIVIPLLIGGVTGYFARSILEGAASMGLSAVLIPVLNGAAEFAIVWGPINAGMGALGAYAGYRLAIRLRPTPAMPSRHPAEPPAA